MRIMAFMLLLSAVLCGGLSAQDYAVDAGVFTVSGGISINSVIGNVEGLSVARQLAFSPSLMYFPISRFAVGVELGYQSFRIYDTDFELLAVGPCAKFFIGGENKDGYPFIQAAYHFLDIELAELPNLTGSGGQFVIGAGYADFVSGHVSLQGAFQYYIQNVELEGADNSQSGSMIAFNAGLSYYIF